MNKNFSLQQITRAGNLDSSLIFRQYNFDLMARFMKIKSVITKLKQNQLAKKSGCSKITSH